MQPITQSFERLWGDAIVFNFLDDSLTDDLKSSGGKVDALTTRFGELAKYAVGTGAQGILFTCSAFGAAVEAARAAVEVPVLKPNEAMIEEAVAIGTRIALVATFEPALAPITAEFHKYADTIGTSVTLQPFLVNGAWDAIQAGDKPTHDRLIIETCATAADWDVVCFAQFSMTAAQPAAENAAGRPTLSTPDSAVKKLKALLA
jgi:Asp/Glu/hydantoin racemase